MKRLDVPAGTQFFDLTVVGEAPIVRTAAGQVKRVMRLRCACGSTCEVHLTNLRNGHTKSCGCRPKRKCYPPGEVAKTLLWIAYRKRARRDGRAFTLKKEQFLALTQGLCHYCGAEPANKYRDLRGEGVFVYNGLDRKDSSLGYTLTNVVACCSTCNFAKRDRSYDEFLAWVKRVCERRV